MAIKKDIRLIVPLLAHKNEDVTLRDRVEVAAKTLGVSKGALIKACLNGALDNPEVFHKYIGLRQT